MPELTPPEGPNELAPTAHVNTGTLGRYKILDELGRGGCGVVYRALDPSIGRTVAIKTILAKDAAGSQESRERFRREARSAGNLSHPNIVTVHDFSDSGDPMYIAMEFVEGKTLAESMSSGPMPLEFILGVLRSAADALDYAHAQNIVHRDVKPANFLINKSGRLKITDFGIAKILDSDEGLTSTGMIVGTVQYMSPEQISEAHVSGRSDQFSLAVIAYELLTGVKPFQGNSWASVIHQIIMAEPPHVTKFRDSLGEAANSALRKALSKDPEARYATCMEFYSALHHALLGSTGERTAIFSSTQSAYPPAPTGSRENVAATQAGKGPSVTAEVLHKTEVTKAASWKPVLIGALGGAVIAAGLWAGLRSKTRLATQVPVTTQPSTPTAKQAEPPVRQPVTTSPVEAAPVTRTAAADKKQPSEPVRTTPPSRPVEEAKAPAPTPVQTAPPPQPVAPPIVQVQKEVTPVVPTVVVPPKPQDDPAKRAADEQMRRAAEEQAKRLAAEEQARRAADDQARRLAEQAKVARATDNDAISRALGDYQAAYSRKDLGALRTVWPSIPKQSLEGIRSSFRDASEVSMELRPVGEPKIAGGTATVVCDRNLRQVILKRVLQASGKVRISLVRAGNGWIIQSVDAVDQ